MNRSVCALLLALACAPTAAETWLVASVASYHVNRAIDHNERNPGLGIEQDIGWGVRAVAGAYENSEYRRTVYAGVLAAPLELGRFRVGATFGLATGYAEQCGRDPCAVVVPTVTYELGRFGVNALIAPPSRNNRGVIGLQVKVRF
jgi:hypothetical protein